MKYKVGDRFKIKKNNRIFKITEVSKKVYIWPYQLEFEDGITCGWDDYYIDAHCDKLKEEISFKNYREDTKDLVYKGSPYIHSFNDSSSNTKLCSCDFTVIMRQGCGCGGV